MRGAARSVWVLRGILVVAVVGALFAGAPEGYLPPAYVVVVVVLGSLVSALRPDHVALEVSMAVVLVWWALQLRAEVPTGSLVAAAALVTGHVAGILLGYGPPQMVVELDVVMLWVMRGAMVWLAAPAIWFVARVYGGHATPTSFWLAGLATALVGAVVAAVLAPTGDGRREA